VGPGDGIGVDGLPVGRGVVGEKVGSWGPSTGAFVGAGVSGTSVGPGDGMGVEGNPVGRGVVGENVGAKVPSMGAFVGESVGEMVGASVGEACGAPSHSSIQMVGHAKTILASLHRFLFALLFNVEMMAQVVGSPLKIISSRES